MKPRNKRYPIFFQSTFGLLGALLFVASAHCDDSKTANKVGPILKDGRTQVVPEFKNPKEWIRHDLWVDTGVDSDKDGKKDRVHVGVTRPWQTKSGNLKLPVIFICSPYFGGTPPNARDYFWDVRHELGARPKPRTYIPPFKQRGKRPIISNSHIRQWVPHGYVVVHASSPGTGLSQGCPTIGRENESLACKAVIDWLNGRACGFTTPDGKEQVHAFWSTGKVGMTGTSHPGTFALAAATTGVDGLEVIIPIAPNTSGYLYYRSNGLVRHPFGYLGEDIDCMYEFVHNASRKNSAKCNTMVRDGEMAKGMDRLTGDFNEFWAKRDYMKDIGKVKAAVLMAHAFNDWNVMPEHSNRIYQALKARGVPAHIYYHQGGHGGQPPPDMMNRWFARYLYGVQNGVEKGPRAWIVRENDQRLKPTPYKDFPNPAASPTKLYLVGGSPKPGLLSLKARARQRKETIVDNFSFSGSTLAQAEWTNHRLIYLSPKLVRPVHLSGTSSITIKLASSKPAANLSVWLVSLPWKTGSSSKVTDNIITRGWADPQNHKSITKSRPLVPGKFYQMTFDLQPDDQVIPVGQQIGLMIFSSDRDFTLWPDPGTQLTIDLGSTYFTLPVVGGRKAYKKATQKTSDVKENSRR
ncbi:MAG: Xaa-Pro dipeptidyl-peptidase [Gemmataceae bacterium]